MGEARYDRVQRVVAAGFMVRDLVGPDGFESSKAAGVHYLSTDFPEELRLSDDPEVPMRCNPIVAPRSCGDRRIERHGAHVADGYAPPADTTSDEPDAVAADLACIATRKAEDVQALVERSAGCVPRTRARPGGGHHGGMASNVLGGELASCSTDPMTGYYRNGCCDTGPGDVGVHTVCARVTAEFLEFSKDAGNDLSTPQPHFPGLQPGDQWCLCAPRWQEAFVAGKAPDVVLEATHMGTLEWCSLDDLRKHAVTAPEG